MTKAGSPPTDTIKPPLWVNAEITYKCPLHCVFCYNPLNYASTFEKELTTDEWLKALREARELFERDYLIAQINRFGGNISRTANFVGMERSALHRKLKSLGVVTSAKSGVRVAHVDDDAEA